MYLPCLVLPYQRLPSVWYTPLSVFTHTIPFWGGRPAEAVVVGADLLTGVAAAVEDAVLVAGAGVLAVGARFDPSIGYL